MSETFGQRMISGGSPASRVLVIRSCAILIEREIVSKKSGGLGLSDSTSFLIAGMRFFAFAKIFATSLGFFLCSAFSCFLMSNAPQKVVIKVYGDDNVGAQSSAQRDGNRVNDAAVDVPAALGTFYGRKDTGHCHRRPNGIKNRSFGNPDLFTAHQIAGNGAKRNFQSSMRFCLRSTPLFTRNICI